MRTNLGQENGKIVVVELPFLASFSSKTLIVFKLREWVNTLLVCYKLSKKVSTSIPPTIIFGKSIKLSLSCTIVPSKNKTFMKWEGEG